MVGWPPCRFGSDGVPRSCIHSMDSQVTWDGLDNGGFQTMHLCPYAPHLEHVVVVNGAAFANGNGRLLEGDRRTAAQAMPWRCWEDWEGLGAPQHTTARYSRFISTGNGLFDSSTCPGYRYQELTGRASFSPNLGHHCKHWQTPEPTQLPSPSPSPRLLSVEPRQS
jgi:hypothetical protein